MLNIHQIANPHIYALSSHAVNNGVMSAFYFINSKSFNEYLLICVNIVHQIHIFNTVICDTRL